MSNNEKSDVCENLTSPNLKVLDDIAIRINDGEITRAEALVEMGMKYSSTNEKIDRMLQLLRYLWLRELYSQFDEMFDKTFELIYKYELTVAADAKIAEIKEGSEKNENETICS